jgi:hypothetical protein
MNVAQSHSRVHHHASRRRSYSAVTNLICGSPKSVIRNRPAR